MVSFENNISFPTNGCFLIDKPKDITSHDVVRHVRKFLHIKQVGHTGTLDPFATGLLIVCIGKSTRLSQFLIHKDKSYRAKMRLGFATDTQDLTGEPLSSINPTNLITEKKLQETVKLFLGLQKQTPPIFSAKKINGVAAHKLARQGLTPSIVSSTVTIYSLNILSLQESYTDGSMEVEFEVTCSAGTYIRTLAHNIGQLLGCGAHLTELRRLTIGNFSVDKAVTLEKLITLKKQEAIEQYLIKPIEMLYDLPKIHILDHDQIYFYQGQAIKTSLEFEDQQIIAVCNNSSELFGIGRFDTNGKLVHPKIVFNRK